MVKRSWQLLLLLLKEGQLAFEECISLVLFTNIHETYTKNNHTENNNSDEESGEVIA